MLFKTNGLYYISGLLRVNIVLIYGNDPKSRAKFKLLWLKLLCKLELFGELKFVS